jgi:hypothetical protein
VVASAAAVLVAPTTANAAVPGLIYVSAATNFDSVVYKAVRVFCPQGTQLIGGSFNLWGAEGAVVLDDFIPSADNLLVGAGEIVGPGEPADGTTASWEVVATAVCASPLAGYSIQTATSDFRQTTAQQATATCPPGRSIIGAGASLSNGWGQVSISSLLMSEPFGTETTAKAITDKDGYSGSWSITSYAICANAPSGWHAIGSSSNFDTSQTKIKPVFCPAGQSPIGGGWTVPGLTSRSVDTYITRLLTNSGQDANVTITSTAASLPTSNWSENVQAVCADT